jgi:hypothetical protein
MTGDVPNGNWMVFSIRIVCVHHAHPVAGGVGGVELRTVRRLGHPRGTSVPVARNGADEAGPRL